jgi:GTPase Era involved in 16S rRNA processing
METPVVNEQMESLIEKVDNAVLQLSNLADAPSLRELQDLASRLADPRRFVAVFGAFSAGKSSMINAFLGHQILTVSPHPTTATITELHAPDEKSQDGIEVTMKSAAQMWEDVSRALRYLHLQADNLEQAVAKAGQLKSADFPAGARRHVSFLRAFAQGYPRMSAHLGEALFYPLAQLETLTADESVACYLQKISVPVAAQHLATGTVLVDTPGVDSIHRRHTDVAFDYMRHADAILFVLYYTHAFARADEAFLTQLANVQNIVGVNKLFVVINAVDLAANVEEQQAVRNRVVEELHRLGIPQPRVYEVSSQIATAASLLEKDPDATQLEELLRQRLRLGPDEELPSPVQMIHDSGIPELRKDVFEYLSNQAYQLAHSAVVSQFESVHHALNGRVVKLRRLAEDSQIVRREREQARLLLADKLLQLLATGNSAGYEQERALSAEWKELSFHIGERIRLSLSAVFRASFHPGLFRSRDNVKRILHQAASEFMEELNRKVESEIRTLGMRMRVQSNQTLNRVRSELQSQVDDHLAGYLEVPLFGVVDRDALPERVNLEADILSPFFRYFSNPRQFFEQGGQKEMQEAALPAVTAAAAAVVVRLSGLLEEGFLTEFRHLMAQMYGITATKLRESTDESLGSAESLIQYEQTLIWFTEQLDDVKSAGW